MTENRRENFRAPFAEFVAATLFIGRRRAAVQVVEESAGGLSVVTTTVPTYSVDDEGELATDDGRNLQVRIKHFKQCGMNYHIGLQRVEATVQGVDLSDEFAVSAKGLSPAWYAGVLIVGLLFGLAVQTEPVSRFLSKSSFGKYFSYGNPHHDVTR